MKEWKNERIRNKLQNIKFVKYKSMEEKEEKEKIENKNLENSLLLEKDNKTNTAQNNNYILFLFTEIQYNWKII